MKNSHRATVMNRDQTGFNQNFKIYQFCIEYQALFFQSGFLDTADFFKQNKQQIGKNQDSLHPHSMPVAIPLN